MAFKRTVLASQNLSLLVPNPRRFVVHELDVTAPAAVNLFETTIRIVGGLLSAHYLSRDTHPELSAGLGAKAAQLGERLLPAFTASPTGACFSWDSFLCGHMR